ncbi:ATP-binding protein [Vibrio sp. Of7-15]|uniref:tight adherence pilus pseudopilin TadF n=1 Tax=Vibrio sp. Of7-15 TaxID=2724879 RepID=UPI001EF281C6|nr:tight adherence pilus pseudopilin TadF [Vibrio sp. Of7-15]MCG7497042.1 ATP-binding protein [Vibrio sp. Of7-15]
MNVRSLKSKLPCSQRGTFSVEFAIVGIFFALLLVFSGDIIIKMSIKGKLDRLAFSMVSILKERTELYDDDYKITSAEVDAIFDITRNSLARTLGSYEASRLGMLVEEQTFRDINSPNAAVRFSRGQQTCQVSQFLSQLTDLSVVTSWGRQASLYRVTLCYETDNWVGELLGEQFTTVSTNAIMIGR